jgi:hypothetical protein
MDKSSQGGNNFFFFESQLFCATGRVASAIPGLETAKDRTDFNINNLIQIYIQLAITYRKNDQFEESKQVIPKKTHTQIHKHTGIYMSILFFLCL